jgi:hypothetical protein
MSTSVSAVWKDMSPEDFDGQPYLGDGGASWGDWLCGVHANRWLTLRLWWWGCAAILTYRCDGMPDSEVLWVSPKEMMQAAARVKDYVKRKKLGTRKLVELHAKHAPGAKAPEMEFIEELDDLIRIARFVESVGGKSMTMEVSF